MLTIPSKSTKEFNFTVDCRSLEQGIQKILAASAGVESQYALICDQSKLYVCCYGSSVFALALVANATSQESGICDVDLSILQGLVKNRSTVEFTYKQGVLRFKLVKGKYSGEMETRSISEDQLITLKEFVELSKDKSITLEQTTFNLLKESIAKTAIKNVFSNDTTPLHNIVFNKNKLQVSAYDNYHFSLYETAIPVKLNLRFSVPINYLTLLDKFKQDDDISITPSTELLKFIGKSFILFLPTIQVEEEAYTLVQSFIESLVKDKNRCVVAVADLVTALNNSFSIYKENTSLEMVFKTAKDSINLIYSSSKGSVTESIKVEKIEKSKDVTCKVEPKLLLDLTNLFKSNKTVKFSVYEQSILFLIETDEGKYTYVTSLL